MSSPALAADPPVVVNWLPGEACPGFGLQVELFVDAGRLTFRTFIDKNGNVARVLQAGKNFPLRFTNTQSGTTYDVKAEGAVQHIKLNPDGTTTLVLTGHTVISYTVLPNLPPDPLGPATIRYVGRLILTIDSSGVLLASQVFHGQQTDICAALAP